MPERILTPEEWYRLVNQVRDLAEAYGLPEVKSCIKFIERCTDLAVRKPNKD